MRSRGDSLDCDATPIEVHSEKGQAVGHQSGAYGFNPLAVGYEREVLADILRRGNPGANNASDHLTLLERSEQVWKPAIDADAQPREGA